LKLTVDTVNLMYCFVCYTDGVWRGSKLLNLKDIVDRAVAKCDEV